MKKNNLKSILITVLIQLNCMSHKTSLLDQNLTYTTEYRSKKCLFVNQVTINESDKELKDILENLMKSNIKIILESNKIFKDVNFYNKFSESKDCYLIDISFLEYENQLNVHPNYFPLSFLTLTLYIWFGGPIVTYESNIKMNVTVTNFENNKVKSEIFETEYKIDDNIYNGWFSRREIPSLKSKFIVDSILKTISQ